jgi:hypothetical protein
MGVPGIRYLDQGSRGMRTIPEIEAKIASAEQRVAEGGPLADMHKENLDQYRRELEHTKANPPSYNYAVFDDKLLNIVGKLGIAGALAAGVISQMQADQLKEQGYQ